MNDCKLQQHYAFPGWQNPAITASPIDTLRRKLTILDFSKKETRIAE